MTYSSRRRRKKQEKMKQWQPKPGELETVSRKLLSALSRSIFLILTVIIVLSMLTACAPVKPQWTPPTVSKDLMNVPCQGATKAAKDTDNDLLNDREDQACKRDLRLKVYRWQRWCKSWKCDEY